jgi:hypothetical protein
MRLATCATTKEKRVNYRMPKGFSHMLVAGAVAVLSISSYANQINDQIAALSEENRQTIFARMMQREGERCQGVNKTFFQGQSSDGAAFWSIACGGGKEWQIMIKNTATGDLKLVECSVLRAVGGGLCFTKFKKK